MQVKLAECTDLYIDLVTTENDGDVFTHALEITVPVGNVLVCDPRRDVEHNDTALSLDVISISQTTELFLASCVPDVETDGTKVGGERERVDLDTKCG